MSFILAEYGRPRRPRKLSLAAIREFRDALREAGLSVEVSRRAAIKLHRAYWGCLCECGLPAAICSAIWKWQRALQAAHGGEVDEARRLIEDAEETAKDFAPTLAERGKS